MTDYPQTIRRRLSKNVRYLRTLHGLTQEALAERVGNTHKHIGEIERARVNVGLDVVSKLGRASLPTLGGSELGEGDGGRVAGVRLLGRGLYRARRFLYDLPSQLICVAGTLSCSGRHGPILSQRDARMPARKIETRPPPTICYVGNVLLDAIRDSKPKSEPTP